ncbi:30S ribosomal protein S11 [Striga asiatica]|uniref:30S ribosomal protein S11 n=1 Tax=Striga asiatica TaxID=4170 RepID=A0A5A7RG91_STRAF|nr:30S ribosomal protein S11 [Striga asiatica]
MRFPRFRRMAMPIQANPRKFVGRSASLSPSPFSSYNATSLTHSSIYGSVSNNLTPTHALNLTRPINSGKPAEDEAGRTPLLRSMDYVKGLLHERGNGLNGRAPPQQRGTSIGGRAPPYQQPLQLEANADVVHIRLMRNNAFVTVTDSKGNKKFGVTAGQLAGKGGKVGRYSGEAAAENAGRKVRQMKTRSVVVKVNGFTFFRRKKDAILSFRDGYSNSRSDVNPVVYLEDTTRKPHNGCRLPKKRRI